jgi:hypothetical protein
MSIDLQTVAFISRMPFALFPGRPLRKMSLCAARAGKFIPSTPFSSSSPNVTSQKTASVVLWSEFLATYPEALVRFPALPEKKVVSLERGPLSLVSTTEELLERKVAAPV